VPPLLLDTHAWVWSLTNDPRLTDAARAGLSSAPAVYVSPISFFEIAQKVRIGKWPEMATYADRLPELLHEQNGFVAGLSPLVATKAGMLDWPHRDPFDRIIAVSALIHGMTLVSADNVFDTLQGLRRLW